MLIIYLFLTSIILYQFLFSRFHPIKFFISTWIFVLMGAFIAPLNFIHIGSIFSPLFYLLLLNISVIIGFYSVNFKFKVNDYNESRINFNLILKIGIVGILLSLTGGFVRSYSLLLNFDISSIRDGITHIESANLYEQVGSVLRGLALFSISYYFFNFNSVNRRLETFLLILFILFPITIGGRQGYLIFFSLIYFNLKLKYINNFSFKKGNLYEKSKIRFIYILVITLLFSMVLISIFRFDIESALHFETKLNMLSNYSSVSIRNSFESILNLPQGIQDLIFEFNYYFGSQIYRFVELFNLNELPLINFDFINKSPFLARNLDKFFPIKVYGISDIPSKSGFISSFTWSTSNYYNIILYGKIGAVLINLIFGIVLRTTFDLFRNNKNSFVISNFLIANSILIIYDIISYPLLDTDFFVYYILSSFYFIKKII